jgi:hypothetical protein
MRVHLLTFNDAEVSRDEVLEAINRVSSVKNWIAFLPASICLASELPAQSLAREIRQLMPTVHFLLVEIDQTKKNGWLPRQVWDFINRPQAVA